MIVVVEVIAEHVVDDLMVVLEGLDFVVVDIVEGYYVEVDVEIYIEDYLNKMEHIYHIDNKFDN